MLIVKHASRTEGPISEAWRGWFSKLSDTSTRSLMNLIARPVLVSAIVGVHSQKVESLVDSAKQRNFGHSSGPCSPVN